MGTKPRATRASGVIGWTALAAISCAHTGGPGPAEPDPTPAETVTFEGAVRDQAGQPIADARVDLNGREARSAANGGFRVAVPRAATYILALSHRDFADFAYVTRTPLRGQTYRLARAQISTHDPSRVITLHDTRPELAQNGIGGARFTLPAGSLVDAQGRAPAGQVRAAIATLDVGKGEGPGDWAVRSDAGEEGLLVSYGAVFLQFTDPAGAVRYQLASGRSGQLSQPVLPSMQPHAASAPQAPLWHFDPRDGYWKHAGSASFDAATNAYVGSVEHLSTINTDIAKFGEAACLRVELDPSIAVGHELRIRYHSGGTPFGQAPSFVLADSVNAAYRLPANTNVLVELFNATDEAVGSFVVQDPPGTALANTVVNTGAALAPGESLWPLPPYAACKPIRIAAGMPQVELRINELPSSIAAEDNPLDDYITWAPTFALARLTAPASADVTVVLTNDSPNRGGDVQFAAYQEPWPAATTATASTLILNLPADGAWVPFAIAGKFGTPSLNDKDAIIEAHHDDPSGALLGQKALMVRVRKNANALSAAERDRFLLAWRGFRNKASGANYVQFQEMHRLASGAGDEAHSQPAFLSWHRAMLLHVERELQKIDPTVALHYWNWDAAAPNVFHQDFMGAPGAGGFIAEPVFSASNPLLGWNTDLPFNGGELRRNIDDHKRDPAGAMKPLDHPVDPSLVRWTDYGPTTSGFVAASFSDDVERFSHNPAHGWPCAGGHLVSPNRSAADPLFYLLHSQIDRQWAYWQWKHERHGVVGGGAVSFPAPQHYDNAGNFDSPGNVADANFKQQGSFLEDGLWPWDGTSGGTPNTPEWRPASQASGPGTNVPLSTPLIPTTGFPASTVKNVWPQAEVVPRNKHMIDYLGKFQPQDGLGFSYDDVAY